MTFDIAPFRKHYPFEGHFESIGGHKIHYVDEGEGDPIVCVHGNPTWSFMYRELIHDLRSDHRVIAPDHVGCGLSDKPGDDAYSYTLAQRIDDLDNLLTRLNVSDNVTIIAHDWGGMIAMGWALRHVDAVKRIVLLNTAAFLLPAGLRLPWQLKFIRSGGPIAALLVRGFNLFAYGASRVAAFKRMRRSVRKAYLAPYDCWAHRIATLRFVQDIPLRPGDRSYDVARHIDDNLHRLAHLPTLLCWGMRDFVFNAQFLDEWQHRVPDARVRSFLDAGHYVLEDAGDAIRPILREFLSAHPVDSPTRPTAEATP